MKEKTFYLWLDDMRPCPYKDDETTQCKLAHSVNKAIKYLLIAEKQGYENFILDLDHDLGDFAFDGGDGIEFVKWLVETGRTTKKYKVMLHTMNIVGKVNMLALVDRYWEG